MPRSKGEYYFEYRLRGELEEAGWLVVKCASSRPFDIIAIKDDLPVVVEVKHKDGRYPSEQERKQIALAEDTGNNYLLLRQAEKRGKIHGKFYHRGRPDDRWMRYARQLLNDLGIGPEYITSKWNPSRGFTVKKGVRMETKVRRIYEYLAENEATDWESGVTSKELQDALDLTQSTASRKLRQLMDDRYVTRDREGNDVRYWRVR